MALLMIRCPATGCEVSTGIRIPGSDWNHMAEFYAYTRCPICQSDHEWSEKDVRLSKLLEDAA